MFTIFPESSSVIKKGKHSWQSWPAQDDWDDASRIYAESELFCKIWVVMRLHGVYTSMTHRLKQNISVPQNVLFLLYRKIFPKVVKITTTRPPSHKPGILQALWAPRKWIHLHHRNNIFFMQPSQYTFIKWSTENGPKDDDKIPNEQTSKLN